MNELLITLPGGVLIIALAFVIIRRVFSLPSKFVAMLVAICALGVYVPLVFLTRPGADVVAIHVAVYTVMAYVLGIIGSQIDDRANADGRKQRWFHWAPATIVGFFLVVLVVDTGFILMAQSGIGSDLAKHLFPTPRSGSEVSSFFPGTVAHDFQEKEDEYNAFLTRLHEQKKRGWQIRKGWLNTPVVGETSVFQVQIFDRDGNPVDYASVSGFFMRPADSKRDQAFVMQALGDGIYQARLILSEPGIWDLLLTIKKDDDVHELKGTTNIAARTE
jgi:nitrogen fixation protein FixH